MTEANAALGQGLPSQQPSDSQCGDCKPSGSGAGEATVPGTGGPSGPFLGCFGIQVVFMHDASVSSSGLSCPQREDGAPALLGFFSFAKLCKACARTGFPFGLVLQGRMILDESALSSLVPTASGYQ